jgi:hypothetical protein
MRKHLRCTLISFSFSILSRSAYTAASMLRNPTGDITPRFNNPPKAPASLDDIPSVSLHQFAFISSIEEIYSLPQMSPSISILLDLEFDELMIPNIV